MKDVERQCDASQSKAKAQVHMVTHALAVRHMQVRT